MSAQFLCSIPTGVAACKERWPSVITPGPDGVYGASALHGNYAGTDLPGVITFLPTDSAEL